jgi:hypothetical protein
MRGVHIPAARLSASEYFWAKELRIIDSPDLLQLLCLKLCNKPCVTVRFISFSFDTFFAFA